jgi:hypothetical protein
MMAKEAKRDANDPGLDRILRAAVKHDFPVNTLRNVDAGAALIDRHPDTRFIIDHLAILQLSTLPAPPQPWADLPKAAPARCPGDCLLSRTFGTHWLACSMPGVSTAACGERTGLYRRLADQHPVPFISRVMTDVMVLPFVMGASGRRGRWLRKYLARCRLNQLRGGHRR